MSDIFSVEKPPNWIPKFPVFACKKCAEKGIVVAVGLHAAALAAFMKNKRHMTCPMCGFEGQMYETAKGKIVDRQWYHCFWGLSDWKKLDGLEIVKEPKFEIERGVLEFEEGDFPLLRPI